MDHTIIVSPRDLEDYTKRTESQQVIPELIYRLVKASAHSLSAKIPLCRIPHRDAVNQPGWDGLVEIDSAYDEFVPEGKSYWETGCGAKPQKKATDEFKKRTKAMPAEDRLCAAFVFVTPRSSGSEGWTEPQQTRWLKSRRTKGWNLVRIIDGVKLADWLKDFPAIGKWIAKEIDPALSFNAYTTAVEHWENIQADRKPDDPALPAKVFTIERESACAALHALFRGESKKLYLSANSRRDVNDLVAAFLESLDQDTARAYGNRCLFVKDKEAWHSLTHRKASHVLIPHPDLGLDSDNSDLQTVATKQGHSIVVPFCGSWPGNAREIIRLRSPSRSALENTLTEAGYSPLRARELAAAGVGSLSALVRHLRGLGDLPEYATWENARVLAQAGLAGKWHGMNLADQSALELLLGKTYGEWIEIVRSEALRADTPLIQQDENWKMVPRGEAWSALGPRLSDDDLNRFQECAIRVLSERDPKFDLPKEEHFAASIHGKSLQHSGALRKGIAESLALLGSRKDALTSCSHGNAETVAVLTVRSLLKQADWRMWASLDHVLPLLAEAAPDEFLDAVETAVEQPAESPFHQVFAQEGSGGMGWNYTSGLLWALETLAWHSDYLVRVTLILGDLAAIDPGGNWTNRPVNSLADIYLPWHVQTCASLSRRKTAVQTLINEQPAVGWKLLLSLLPHNHGFTSGTRRPAWQNFISSEWRETITNREYSEQISAYTELAIGLATSDIAKLPVLIGRLPDLEGRAWDSVLGHLRSDAITSLPESARLPLWNALGDLARHHRKFADTDWAMSRDVVKKIEEVAEILSPKLPRIRHQRLFGGPDFELYDEKGNYDEQRKKLESLRQSAILEILEAGGMADVMSFAKEVSSPQLVGQALGNSSIDSIDSVLLPDLLQNEDSILSSFIGGFIWGRFRTRSWPWVDTMLECNWDTNQKAAFLVLLPFVEEAWARVEVQLGHDEGLYWTRANANQWSPQQLHLTKAALKLIQHNRPNAAVQCLSQLADAKLEYNPDIAVRALWDLLTSEKADKAFDHHAVIEVIKSLQECANANPGDVFKIEWNYLPMLDRFSGGSPKILDRRLADDPAFYCEVIRLVFRSEKEEKQTEEPTEHRRNQAQNAYRLLDEWRTVPGMKTDGSFDDAEFAAWTKQMKRLAEETGHLQIALSQFGKVLTHSPRDTDGLWIHHSIAKVLNAKDAKEMRSGFTCSLFNQRGVHGFTSGKEEREIAQRQRERAEALEAHGYARFATAMREFAAQYERDAERQAARSPFED